MSVPVHTDHLPFVPPQLVLLSATASVPCNRPWMGVVSCPRPSRLGGNPADTLPFSPSVLDNETGGGLSPSEFAEKCVVLSSQVCTHVFWLPPLRSVRLVFTPFRRGPATSQPLRPAREATWL